MAWLPERKEITLEVLDRLSDLSQRTSGSDDDRVWEEFFDLLYPNVASLIEHARADFDRCAITRNGITMLTMHWRVLKELAKGSAWRGLVAANIGCSGDDAGRWLAALRDRGLAKSNGHRWGITHKGVAALKKE